MDSTISRRNLRREVRLWLVNQHRVRWRGHCSTQRQARELVSGPYLDAKTRFLSLNRTQSRVVIGLLTGHSALTKHLHLKGLTNSPLYKGFGAEEETSTHILCECVALASLRRVYLGSFFLDPEDVKFISLGPSGTLVKEQGSPEMVSDYGAQRACQLRPRCIGTVRAQTQILINK
jgi:hypothetical protein